MARKPRDYAAEYARRQARARELGFSGYYERRTRPRPGAPKPPPAELRRKRGHASGADLKREVKAGALVQVQRTDRDPETGRLKRVELLVIDADGKEKTYVLTGNQLSQRNLDAIGDAVNAAGGIVSPVYSVRGVYEVDEEDLELELEDDVDVDFSDADIDDIFGPAA